MQTSQDSSLLFLVRHPVMGFCIFNTQLLPKSGAGLPPDAEKRNLDLEEKGQPSKKRESFVILNVTLIV